MLEKCTELIPPSLQLTLWPESSCSWVWGRPADVKVKASLTPSSVHHIYCDLRCLVSGEPDEKYIQNCVCSKSKQLWLWGGIPCFVRIGLWILLWKLWYLVLIQLCNCICIWWHKVPSCSIVFNNRQKSASTIYHSFQNSENQIRIIKIDKQNCGWETDVHFWLWCELFLFNISWCCTVNVEAWQQSIIIDFAHLLRMRRTEEMFFLVSLLFSI